MNHGMTPGQGGGGWGGWGGWDAWAAATGQQGQHGQHGQHGSRAGHGSHGRHGQSGQSGQPWGQGPPPWVAGLLGLAGQQAPRGPRARRGDVRAAILDVLATEPMNGYQVIQQIAERSGGVWKPSPGSVYPTLQQLEDEGLVEGSETEGRRTLRLTEEGQAYVEAHPEEMAQTWQAFTDAAEGGEAPTHELKPVIGQVLAAVWQIVMSGNRQQQAEAAEILADTRRRLYGLLADGEGE